MSFHGVLRGARLPTKLPDLQGPLSSSSLALPRAHSIAVAVEQWQGHIYIFCQALSHASLWLWGAFLVRAFVTFVALDCPQRASCGPQTTCMSAHSNVECLVIARFFLLLLL